MSYVPQGEVDYTFHEGETVALYLARLRAEQQQDITNKAIAAKIKETEEMFKQSNAASTAGVAAGYGTTGIPQAGVSAETIVMVGAAAIVFFMIARK